MKVRLHILVGVFVVLAATTAIDAHAEEGALMLQADVAVINPGDAQAGQGDDEPRLAALRNQYQPLLKVELSFANRVCSWTAEQRKTAIEAANSWLRDFARDNAKNQQAFQGGFVVFAGNGPFGAGVAALPDPPEKGLREKLRGAMTEDQKSKYEAEKAKREDFLADAQVDNVIAIMDQRLNLSPEQRLALQKSLHKNWNKDWAPPLQMFIQMSEYMPAVPDEFVVPHLAPEQRVQWQGMQKLSARGIVFGGGAFGNPSQTIDDIDLSEGQEKKK